MLKDPVMSCCVAVENCTKSIFVRLFFSLLPFLPLEKEKEKPETQVSYVSIDVTAACATRRNEAIVSIVRDQLLHQRDQNVLRYLFLKIFTAYLSLEVKC